MKIKLNQIIVVAALLAVGARAMADDEIPLKKLPAPVQAALKQIIGDGKFEHCDSDVTNVYEVDFKAKGAECSVTIDADGNVLETVLDVPINIVPAAVLDAIKKAHPDGKIRDPEIHNKGGQMFYELEVQAGKDKYHLDMDAAGKVITDEKDTETDAEPEKN
jgi:uncharacterized membrane protein YkoI